MVFVAKVTSEERNAVAVRDAIDVDAMDADDAEAANAVSPDGEDDEDDSEEDVTVGGVKAWGELPETESFELSQDP